jgi:nicotinate-nucleotide adenylyltransferase
MVIVFGGSFDPVHVGHLILARDVKEHFGASRLIFVPAALSPFKDRHSASAEDRLNMLRLAVEQEEGFSVEDLELRRGGRSYTVDTLEELSKNIPEKLYFLMGMDSFLSFHRWKRYRQILRLVGLIVMDREGSIGVLEEYVANHLPEAVLGQNLFLFKGRRIDVSSTEIRDRLRRGLSVRYLVPEAVYRYILDRGLYRDAY